MERKYMSDNNKIYEKYKKQYTNNKIIFIFNSLIFIFYILCIGTYFREKIQIIKEANNNVNCTFIIKNLD
jgi:hypothetical protein